MKTLSTAIILVVVTVLLFGCAPNAKEKKLEKFITAHVEKIKPLAKETNLAYWKAAILVNQTIMIKLANWDSKFVRYIVIRKSLLC